MDEHASVGARPVVNESGIEIKPLYTAEDVAASGGERLGDPGHYPFTRGIHELMYRKRPWTMRQYTGFGNAAETNKRFHYLIANGQTGLNVALDLPTQCGLDSDAPEAQGEVGRVGMAVDTLRDFEIAFDGIDLDKITVSLTINGAAAILIMTVTTGLVSPASCAMASSATCRRTRSPTSLAPASSVSGSRTTISSPP